MLVLVLLLLVVVVVAAAAAAAVAHIHFYFYTCSSSVTATTAARYSLFLMCQDVQMLFSQLEWLTIVSWTGYPIVVLLGLIH